ncbi:TPA: hypothetical protein PXP47_003881 [Yersinia enterocolitica]|nr:hypothetical protein [Yersinia enterocolitica]
MRRFWVKTIIPLLNKYTVSALIAFFIALLLLLTHFLSGSEFVGFVVAIAVFTLVLKLLPSIQEFSIAGNTVKLRETVAEAKSVADELKKLSLETKRNILSLIMRPSGMFGASFGDNRAKDFIQFYNEIQKSDDIASLKEELQSRANLLKSSIDDNLQKNIGTNFEDYDALQVELIHKDPNCEKDIKLAIQQAKELKDIIAELESK